MPLTDEEGDEEVHPAGDLPEGLQDVGEQMEERPEEEIPPGNSPPQVPPKLLPQLSPGDGEYFCVPYIVNVLSEWLYTACCHTIMLFGTNHRSIIGER